MAVIRSRSLSASANSFSARRASRCAAHWRTGSGTYRGRGSLVIGDWRLDSAAMGVVADLVDFIDGQSQAAEGDGGGTGKDELRTHGQALREDLGHRRAPVADGIGGRAGASDDVMGIGEPGSGD